MKVDILLGLQWGDEGKGKIVDVLSENYDVVARFQGGPNAGHSLAFNDAKFVLHLIPSGIFRPDTLNIIGNGVVIDPVTLWDEITGITLQGIPVTDKLMISNKAHLITPAHKMLDKASEMAKGKAKIGSTLRGIGPTYMDKTGRYGLRVGDIFRSDFETLYKELKNRHIHILRSYGEEFASISNETSWFEAIENLRKCKITDTEFIINDLIKSDQKILAEGAQGTLLDIEFGSYPFVTSSNTICAGACTGLGFAPSNTGKVYGIFKAYCTRVGSGPFPTELSNETGDRLRQTGQEFGATTGRPRRCGWMDLVALKYAAMLNGVTNLILTKPDVLDDFDEIKIATHYGSGNNTTEHFTDYTDDKIPFYQTFKGWKTAINKATKFDQLPPELKKYIQFIENETGIPVSIVSVGPDRKETIVR